MKDEKELELHKKHVTQIDNANSKADLPNITLASIAAYLSSNIKYNGKTIRQAAYKPFIEAINDYGILADYHVRDAFIQVMKDNFDNISDMEALELYKKVISMKKIYYILKEIDMIADKLYYLNLRDDFKKHFSILREIKNAQDVKLLPKVGLSELNQRILKNVNDNDFIKNFKVGDITEISNAYINHEEDLEPLVDKICDKQDLTNEDKILMKSQIIGSLVNDRVIEYIIEEIETKEAKKQFIYKQEYEDTMEAIKDSRRISQLPYIPIGELVRYFCDNSTISTNDNRFIPDDFKQLAYLFLNGNKWEDQVVKDEIIRICYMRYPEDYDACIKLYNKLSVLPKTYYLVNEINYVLVKSVEFIKNSDSNVNVYVRYNGKNPNDSGRFYNIYISRIKNLDLDSILPLDIDDIIPPNMDLDAVEWYIQEHYDETFKTAGGLILNKDETIGDIHVFRPNDGKVGVSKEEKEKLDAISDLDRQILEKQNKLSSLDSQITDDEDRVSRLKTKIYSLIGDYENRANQLQAEFNSKLQQLKDDFDYSDTSYQKTRK